MLDQFTPFDATVDAQVTAPFELVVVGAGVAGLNALYAATEYLPKGARVLLVDQKDAAGGMWNTAYDYVRLHQPHPMFTVGDMRWDWKRPRDYLAKRDEVRAHLASALVPIGRAVDLNCAFGHSVSAMQEIDTEDGPRAQITLAAVDDPAKTRTVIAQRVIHAPGLNYHVAEPLSLSSASVVSIIPQDLGQTLRDHPDAALYVVGGGKTGMDTVLAALAHDPQRRVSMIKGRGTNFLNRTRYLPTGTKRWTSGELVSRLFRDIAHHFDGDNEDEAVAYFRKTYSTDPASDNGVFLYGLQSEDEHSRIQEGLAQNISGYLVDVTDGAEGPQIVMRDGATIPVPPGSIFVNCSGSFFRGDTLAEEMPFMSPHGTIISINARDGMHFLTSVAGFFSAHLLYRDALRGTGFYRLDHEALFRENRNAWVGASAAQAYMTQVLAVQNLPMSLLDRCGLDLDRWYPLPRRLVGLWRMKSTASEDIAKCRAILDRVADRFGVRCGPID